MIPWAGYQVTAVSERVFSPQLFKGGSVELEYFNQASKVPCCHELPSPKKPAPFCNTFKTCLQQLFQTFVAFQKLRNLVLCKNYESSERRFRSSTSLTIPRKLLEPGNGSWLLFFLFLHTMFSFCIVLLFLPLSRSTSKSLGVTRISGS